MSKLGKFAAKLEGRIPFPTESDAPIPAGAYYIECPEEDELTSEGPTPESKIWFTSPRLEADTIKRIDAVQLLADSRDQGLPDDLSAGNWTWFELAIFSDDGVRSAANTEVALAWKSHSNRFNTETFGWKEGAVFGEKHDMMAMLQDGDAIAVRLCARFRGWSIMVRKAYLLIDLGTDEVERPPPPAYDEAIDHVKSMESLFVKVNAQLQPAFTPQLPPSLLTSAGGLGDSTGSPLRVLSLDGGGVRGISSLLLLKGVMDKFAPGRLPCEVFDLIGGTSTGGYIAIMLGRLRMSIDECLATYEGFMKQIFDKGWWEKNKNFVKNGYFYSGDELEGIIKGLVEKKLGDANAPLVDPADPNPRCKVFCMAVHQQAVNNRAPVFLRSYTNPQEKSELPSIKVWQAARATSAAPAYFKPIMVDGFKLVDGGLGANNPMGWLWNEVLGVFGPVRPIDCFLSLGTGIPPNVELTPFGVFPSHDVEKAWVSTACNSEIVNVLFRSLVDAFAPRPMARKYFRLNVAEVVPPTKPGQLPSYAAIGELDDTKAVANLKHMTDEYMARADVAKLLEDAAKALSETLDAVKA
ncbi:acyl transferase/acyl hydrolase/lysophospholipase [Daedaleopsis nitida]|nr:acyl transferase/acyl hydrolase/lysophospholipase [Daedaleopsis nitida]